VVKGWLVVLIVCLEVVIVESVKGANEAYDGVILIKMPTVGFKCTVLPIGCLEVFIVCLEFIEVVKGVYMVFRGG